MKCFPVAIVGPGVIDVDLNESTQNKENAKKSKRAIYCTSCEVITKHNPARNVSGFLKHVKEDHGSYNNRLPDIDQLCKAYNVAH